MDGVHKPMINPMLICNVIMLDILPQPGSVIIRDNKVGKDYKYRIRPTVLISRVVS